MSVTLACQCGRYFKMFFVCANVADILIPNQWISPDISVCLQRKAFRKDFSLLIWGVLFIPNKPHAARVFVTGTVKKLWQIN